MASFKITLTFDECAPAPALGYNVRWRIQGTGDPYTNAGNFLTSPAVFYVDKEPGDVVEGFIKSQFFEDILCNDVPFTVGSVGFCCDPVVNEATVDFLAPALKLLFDDIANTPVADPTDPTDWNAFFDTGANADTPFTSVVVVGPSVTLSGATNLIIPANLFSPGKAGNDHLIEIIDYAGIVTGIETQAFANCINLEAAVCVAAAYISGEAFANCTSLAGLDFSAAVTVGDFAFMNCSSLPTAEFFSCTTIGTGAFSSSGISIAHFANCTDIGAGAFSYCTNLAGGFNVYFPLVTNIGASAFYGCTSVDSFSFPSATTTGNASFFGCTALVSANLPLATSIASQSFEGCTSLTTATISSVLTIGAYGFRNCSSLISLDANTATAIGANTFDGCTAMTSLILSSCSDLGGSSGDNGVFNGITGNTFTLVILGATAGDGDVVTLQANNTVTLITV